MMVFHHEITNSRAKNQHGAIVYRILEGEIAMIFTDSDRGNRQGKVVEGRQTAARLTVSIISSSIL